MFLSEILTNLHDLDSLQELEFQGDYPCTSYAKDLNGKYLGCNLTQAKIVGLAKREDIIGNTDFEMFSRTEADNCRVNDSVVMHSNHFKICYEPFTSYAGMALIGTSIKTPLLSNTKKIIGIIGLSIIQSARDNNDHQYGLTARQLDCLYHLVIGKSAKQIAQQLQLSNRTVEHYVEAIKCKLHCYSRSELIKKALAIPYIKNRL